MAQYTYYIDEATGRKIRDGIRDEMGIGTPHYVIDKELTDIGFEGEKDKDWENIKAIN